MVIDALIKGGLLMSDIIYHPMTGEKVNINTLTSSEIRSPNRLYKPTSWRAFYAENEDENNARLFGLEFEFNALGGNYNIDFDTIGRTFLKALNHHGQHVHILEDHSVRNGIEVIFQPMSLAYLKEHIDFKLFFDLAKKLNLSTTHDTGFHIHVNIKPTLRERNLILRLFSLSYPLWLMLSERKIIRLQNRYVSTEFFMMSDRIKRRHQKNLKKLLETQSSHVSFQDLYFDNYDIKNRYNAINFTNPKTTEFRLFGGTHDYVHFMRVINFVHSFINLIDEISDTRIDNVFSLHDFVERTQTHHLKEVTHKTLKKAEMLIRHNRLYYNHFYLLDTYWYESTFKYATLHDYIMSKKDYDDYQQMMSSLNTLTTLTENQKLRIKDDINDFLLGATYEVIDNHHTYLDVVPVIHSTTKTSISKSDIEKHYVVLRCINSDLLNLFF